MKISAYFVFGFYFLLFVALIKEYRQNRYRHNLFNILFLIISGITVGAFFENLIGRTSLLAVLSLYLLFYGAIFVLFEKKFNLKALWLEYKNLLCSFSVYITGIFISFSFRCSFYRLSSILCGR